MYLHDEPEIPSGLIGKILEQTVGAGGVPLPVVAARGRGRRSCCHGDAVAAQLPRDPAADDRGHGLLLDRAHAEPDRVSKLGSLRLADLKPAQLSSTLSREFYGARSSVVRYYDNMRFFYQLQSRMRELRRDVETQPQQQQQNQQKQNQPQQKKGGSANVPERGDVLNAQKQATGNRQQATEERAVFGVRRAEKRKAAVVLVSAETESSLGDSTGLQKVNVEGSLV